MTSLHASSALPAAQAGTQSADSTHRSSAPTELPRTPTRRDWTALAVLAAGLGLIVLDGTIVSVALPAIMADLRFSVADAQWVTAAYAVVLAGLLLITGRLADRLGRKRFFLLGVILFMAGSLFAAAIPQHLILARIVQAGGAALVMPSTLSTVNALFTGRARAAAFGVWGAVISGAAAIGPLAGGVLTQYLSWHWIFLVNLPIGALLLIAAWRAVPETARPEHTPAGLDVLSATLSAAGFGLAVFALIEGGTLGWWAPERGTWQLIPAWPADAAISPTPFLLAAGVILLGLLSARIILRGRSGKDALIRADLFTIPTFTRGTIAAGTVAMGEFGLIFALPLFLVNAMGLSVIRTGLVLAAMAGGAFLSGAMARHIAGRIGSPGTVLLGLAAEILGIIGLALTLTIDVSLWVLVALLVLYGLGLGLASAQLTGVTLAEVPQDASGQGSAVQSTARQVGTALGTAIAGAALTAAVGTQVAHGPQLADAFLTGTQNVLWLAAAALALGFLVAVGNVRTRRDTRHL